MELGIKELNVILGALNCYMEKDLPKDLRDDVKALRELIKKRVKQQ